MIETKEIRTSFGSQNEYVKDLTAFGWQPTQTTSRRSGRSTSHYQIMARETSMSHYNEYRRFEDDYESAKEDLKSYDSMDGLTVLLLLLLFIFPGIIYIAYKTKQKNEIDAHNNLCRQQMEKALYNARNIR